MSESPAQKATEGWPPNMKRDLEKVRREQGQIEHRQTEHRQTEHRQTNAPLPLTAEQRLEAAQATVLSLRAELSQLAEQVRAFASDAQQVAAFRRREAVVLKELKDADACVLATEVDGLDAQLEPVMQEVSRSHHRVQAAEAGFAQAEAELQAAQREHTNWRNESSDLRRCKQAAQMKLADIQNPPRSDFTPPRYR
jgi:predicted  nucleic acid-binding Zn-ribbon protein